MTFSDAQRSGLLEVIHEAGLGHILGRRPEVAFSRLEEFLQVYAQRHAGTPSGTLPVVTIDTLLEEHKRNSHRVAPLLQALAFNCTANMLAMMWMVLIGSTIEAIDYTYRREQTSRIEVELVLPDRLTRIRFESDEHWDLALLRLVGISKGDDQPLIETFYALHIPPSEGYARLAIDRWTVRVLEWVQDYGSGSFFCPSLIDARNLGEVATAIVDAVQKGWLKPASPKLLESVRHDPSVVPEAVALLSSDAAMSVVLTAEGKRALRRTRFYRRLAHASPHSLEMVRAEINRVLGSSSHDYDHDELAELEDELRAIEALLQDAA
jgi:hypothetical protein